VYNVDSKTVVCTFRDNKSVLDGVAMTIGNIAYLYNNAFLIVETGDKWNISAHVLNVLREEFEEARYYRKRLNQNSRAIIGLVQTKHTKALGYSLLREEFEGHYQITVNDEQLIDELKTFVEIKKRFSLSTAPVYGAAENKHDDLVMGLMLCLIALNDDEFKELLAHADWSEMEEETHIDYVYSDYGCMCSGG
ncbi:TPA: hypothetical protein ACSP3M_004110, partial [Aeromonas veronii]